MNNFKVEIYNNQSKVYEDYTAYAVFSLKGANLLDEQLDEINLLLKGVAVKHYQPLTRVKITIYNAPECKITPDMAEQIILNNELGCTVEYSETTKRITQTWELLMLIANDRAIEMPVGSGRYNHEIYLIEATKITERFIGDSLTFTNALGNGYLDGTSFSYPVDNALPGYSLVPNINELTYDTYKTPLSLKDSFTVLSLNTVASKIITYLEEYNGYVDGHVESFETIDGENVYSGIKIDNGGTITTIGGESGFNNFDETAVITPKNPLKITYTINIGVTSVSNGHVSVLPFNFYYYFYAVNNRLPLKKWTVTDVINRVFDLIEPIQVESTSTVWKNYPRFRLQGVKYNENGKRLSTYESGSQAEKLDKILSPEFSFTRETLRETLQQIGGFIHGEPRVTGEYTDEHGRRYFEVAYDFYGNNKFSKIADKPYITATFGTDVNQYCTALDSSADNLTNTLDWAQGVIVEPFNGYYKSLRTEQTTARLAEDNSTYIATQFPIERMGGTNRVVCKYIPGVGEGEWDITPYVFEESDYLTLSGYEGAYPFSKSYALYYTQGQKNIKGLFFKAEHAINIVFHNYAIVNILRAVTGNNSLKIEGQDLMLLSFAVTYLPIYSARVKTHKQYILDGLPSTLAYNQGANAIETRYYGEHLKGAVERLGNVEKTYTYNLPFLSQIPKIGTRFDKDYFISNVSWEIFPAYIKCTVGLSKHFNRKAQNVGINSIKRMWEVSERQVQTRQTLFPLYIVVSKNEQTTVAQNEKISKPAKLLLNESTVKYDSPVSAVSLVLKDINGENVVNYNITLPVIASAFGNAMTFTYGFEDNYSAGQKVVSVTGDGANDDNVTGYWGANVPYTDYYGRVYYLESHLAGGDLNKGDTMNVTSLPQGAIRNVSDSRFLLLNRRYLYRKDNREIPQITHEIAVVTDNDNIIIGSALCRNCSAVNGSPKTYKLYAFTELLNVIESKVDLTNAVEINGSITINSDNVVIPAVPTNPTIYKAWALVTEQTQTQIAVSAEDGTETTQTIYEGGEILIGENNADLSTAQTIYFTLKNKIYE